MRKYFIISFVAIFMIIGTLTIVRKMRIKNINTSDMTDMGVKESSPFVFNTSHTRADLLAKIVERASEAQDLLHHFDCDSICIGDSMFVMTQAMRDACIAQFNDFAEWLVDIDENDLKIPEE